MSRLNLHPNQLVTGQRVKSDFYGDDQIRIITSIAADSSYESGYKATASYQGKHVIADADLQRFVALDEDCNMIDFEGES